MGMSVLVINYRGSIGMGDHVLQSLIGNMGKMAVEDTHQAIRTTVNDNKELSGEIVLLGLSYGGFISTHLAAKYPSMYQNVILVNPLVDTGASGWFVDLYLESLFGRNVTDLYLPNEQKKFPVTHERVEKFDSQADLG